MPVTIDDKIAQGRTYLEPAVYAIVQRVAAEENVSVSKWLRKIVIRKLFEQGRITQDQLLELAS